MGIRALVVGGTNGIGYAMATRLAAEATTSSVIISGRNKPAAIPHPNMTFRQLDAASMRGIKGYTDAFKASEKEKLDYLIMTQGIMTTAGRTETSEGIDRKMALHYYGKQLLIRELLPVMREDAKVIIVFDGKSGDPDKLNWEDLDLKTTFSLGTAANHCMVMNDAMTQHHATTQSPDSKRHFIHAYPGAVYSNLHTEMPWYLQPLMKGVGRLVSVQPDVCAERLLSGTADRAEEGLKKGKLWDAIDNRGRAIANKKLWSTEERERVARHTWDLVDRAIVHEDSL